ncbi:leukotriene A4 hydrolase C-terminal domain-containing protein, partial [Pseudomonadota bacterium]
LPIRPFLNQAADMARSWSSGELAAEKLPYADWSPMAMVYFISALPAELSEAQLSELDAALGLSRSSNAEIARTWFIQVAERQYRPAYPQMESHLGRYGRIRLVQPVYEALVANGEDRQLARVLFDQARGAYHPLTRAAIEPLFE